MMVSEYARPGPTTEIGEYNDLVRELPDDPVALAGIVRGLVLHQWLVGPAGLELPAERMADRERVGAAAVIERVLQLDAAPLSEARPPEKRMVGYCYHFALLHCALLRAKGITARARCGFARYLRDGAWIDHWVVEFLRGGDWVRIDPDTARDELAPDDFRTAADAWLLCRSGEADPFTHGNHELWGWDELRGSLVADIGALNQVEVGDWEPWCHWIDIPDKSQPNAALDPEFDQLATLASGDDRLPALQHRFATDPRLHPPQTTRVSR